MRDENRCETGRGNRGFLARDRSVLHRRDRSVRAQSDVSVCALGRYDRRVSEQPGVSIVIPTYNRAALVSEAVRSALVQNWEPLEVIVIDDASSDDTVERLSELASLDERVRVIERERNGGESAARNQGILASRYEYVAFLDSDNRFMPGKLEAQMPALVQASDHAVSFSGYVLSADGAESEVVLTHWDSDSLSVMTELLGHCVVNTSTFIARADLLADQGLFRTDLDCCADHELWLRLAALGSLFLYEPQALTFYRLHSGSVSGDLSRVAKYEELVIGDFLARDDLPPTIADRAGEWRARWALIGAERFLDAGMPKTALRALGRASLASPRSIKPGWLFLLLKAAWKSLTCALPTTERVRSNA